jgi:site-specific recombinase XerC
VTITTNPPATTRSDTWLAYTRLFLDYLESVNAATMTQRTYGIAVQQLGDYLRRQGMPADPTRVTREHLVEWLRHMQRPKTEGGQGLTAQTALQRYRSVSRLFAYLVDTDEIRESPMAKMKPPRVVEKMVPVIAEGDLKRLLKAVSGSGFEERRDKAIIGLFIDVGLRISEMAGINLDDIDLGERELRVMQAKGRRPRLIRFVKETRSDVQRYLLVRSRHPHADDDALWLGKRGRLLASGIYRTVQRRCEEAGIPPINPHKFRHTMSHLYLRNGGSEGDLMRLAGWRSRAMVDRYGASASAARSRDAHDLFSARRGL